jgi:uncharacterized Zn-binding protein involved in type VI secretion
MPPAARVGDQHACPTGTHVGGPVTAPGSSTVNIGGQPAARAGDQAQCAGPPDVILQGSPTVFINGRPAARVGDSCSHSGVIVTGCPTVIIGDQSGGAGAGAVSPSPGPGVRRRKSPLGGGTGLGIPPGRAPGPGSPRAVPKPIPRPPAGKTGKEKEKTASQGAPTDSAEDAEPGAEKQPTLFGSPATMELLRAVARLAQQMIPGLAKREPPVDPQVMQATVAELREAIARKDVGAVNAISARLTAMMQPAAPRGGADAAPSSSTGSTTSPWTIPEKP